MIPIVQHRRILTQSIIETFSDMVTPKAGFGAWFPTKTSKSKLVGIEVERNSKKIAADVLPHSEGNYNTFDQSTEKLFEPAEYKEFFDFSKTRYYDVTFGAGNIPIENQTMDMASEAMKKLTILRNKIESSKERQRAQVLQTGIVTFDKWATVDFKRKADSLEALTGNNVWGGTTADIIKDLSTGGEFLRQVGKSATNEIDVICGRDAFRLLIADTKVKAMLENRRINRGELNRPELNDATGLSFHGQISGDDFLFNIWTYNEFYEDESGNYIKMLDNDKVVMLPSDFKGCTSHAALPQPMRVVNNGQYEEFVQLVEAEYNTYNYVDQRNFAHLFKVYSKPLALPVSIDRIYTIQVTE
ncbi:major capsid protein [Muricauda sp. MAR_2010_75]|uniref:major capsid protein n=1 Tax=Allomuricauda sp. MAR_2010_75 TaxID=1250232 RepID=UPI0005615A3A|nr:major capsid protein [Muricauda sp. MAR_2010_75]